MENTPIVPSADTSGAQSGRLLLKAPVAGWLLPITDVPDPVFADRVLGDGFAIDPIEGMLTAPFDGVVTSLHRAGHAVSLKAANGAEVLMHIGIDTVALKGEGFTAHVAEGDAVTTGTPLISFDMDVVAQMARSLVVPVILVSTEGFVLAPLKTAREVKAGDDITLILTAAAAEQGAVVGGLTVSRAVRIADPHGIHARPAGLIAEAVKASASKVTVRFGGRSANAASPVNLLLLGAAHNDELLIEATGEDAEAVVAALVVRIGAETNAAPAPEKAPAVTPAPAKAVQRADLAQGEALSLSGAVGSPGLAVGISFRLVEQDYAIAEQGAGTAAEKTALAAALAATAQSLDAAIAGSTGKQREILDAHRAFLEDEGLRDAAEALIATGKSAAWAWKSAVDGQITALRQLGNQVLAERAADLEDICHRVLAVLLGKTATAPELPADAVVFARDLLPSHFAELDSTKIAALVLAEAGPTAHIAILAASKGIPAIVAAGPDVLAVPDGQTVIVDAGEAKINPPAPDYEAAKSALVRRKAVRATALAAAHEPCVMADGTRIEVVANLGGVGDVADALYNGAEGCGLMRSEFLFLNRTSAPGEDEQYAQYQAIADGLKGRPLIIRTLDAGADKDVPYVGLPEEENPALGLRGVRMSLWQPELLRTQIRAILRVTPFGQTKILLPMIATLEDLRTVRRVIDAEMAALGRTVPIEVGIMVEVPSAALIAARFAAEADFFSVGTNDLTQYTLAIDRVNARLAKQLDSFHPAVLRLIALAAEGAQSQGRWIGVCGSLASRSMAAPLLIGLGVTELSATPGSIAEIKAFVRTLDKARCAEVAAKALTLESGEAVRRLLAETWPEA